MVNVYMAVPQPQAQQEHKHYDHNWVVVEVYYGKPPWLKIRKKICKKCYAEEVIEVKRS